MSPVSSQGLWWEATSLLQHQSCATRAHGHIVEGGNSLTLASSMETRIHTWVHGVNLNFGKINHYVYCIYICFVDLRSSPLDTSVLESLLFCAFRICVNLLKELYWADSTIGVWIYILLQALLLLCSLYSEWTRKFRIDKPGSFEFTYCLAQIRKFGFETRKFRVWQTVNFIRCVWAKNL